MTKKKIYFLGIGGIGMSALAYYFLQKEYEIYGYDLTPSDITTRLIEDGVHIHFEEKIEEIPENIEFVIHTPAVSTEHAAYKYFQRKRIPIYKRAEVLGMISRTKTTIAVAGTHGKTTTTALISHILHPEKNIEAFIGGIAKNINANFIVNENSETMVVEADEYDRSFLTLYPSTAIITSMDADHLDIYGKKSDLEASFQCFADQTEKILVIHEKIAPQINHPNKKTYGFSEKADCFATHIVAFPHKTIFDLHCHGEIMKGVTLGIPGQYNLLNALAAFTAIHAEYEQRGENLQTELILKKLAFFQGVKRRFDYQIYRKDMVYLDDYAHHPQEINSFLSSVKTIFPAKKITAVFQPHLYSRTRDFADEFAKSLSLADEIILLDIYPAREEPISGITSDWLLSKINKKKKIRLSKEALIPYLVMHKPEVLVTIGAGDIDRLVPEIVKTFQ
jgi:UDP-N-acetylmuramate--alanine ligase